MGIETTTLGPAPPSEATSEADTSQFLPVISASTANNRSLTVR